MEKELKIKIKVDAKTGGLEVLSGEFSKIDKSSQRANAGVASFKKSLLGVGAAVSGVIAVREAFDAVVLGGIRYNTMMEDQVSGIRSLIVATSSNVDSMGNVLDIQSKYTLAQKEAVAAMRELESINALTPHTLGETAQIYKTLYANAKAYGASQKEIVEITKLVSIAAGNAGIEFQQLLASVDGLANGTFLANSEMGRFLTSIGLAPVKLKALAAEGKSTEEILRVLRDFDFDAGTFNQSLSNLESSWNNFTGNITKDIFDDLKPAFDSLASFLDDIVQSMNDAEVASQSVFGVKGKDNQIVKVMQLEAELKDINRDLATDSIFDDWFDANDAVLEERKKKILLDLRLLGNEIAKGTQDVAKLVSSNIDTSALASIVIGDDKSIEKSFNTLEKRYGDLTKSYKEDTKALKKIDDDYYKAKTKLATSATKIHKKELDKQAKEAKKILDKQRRDYEQYMRDKARVTAQFNKDYDKTFLKSYQLEEKQLQTQIKEYRRYVDDKLKIDELYQKKHLEILYKDQDKNLKLALDAYTAAGEKEIAAEIKKVIEKNKIVDKYSGILSKEQLKTAVELSDKKVDIALKGEKRIVSETQRLWDDAGKNMYDSITNAFDDILVRGQSFNTSFRGMLTDLLQNGISPFTQSLSDDFSKAFSGMLGVSDKGLTGGGIIGDIQKAFNGGVLKDSVGNETGLMDSILDRAINGYTTAAGSLSGKIDALLGNAGGVNNYLGTTLGTSVGQIAANIPLYSDLAKFSMQAGEYAGNTINRWIGSDTKADEWGKYMPIAGSTLGALKGEWTEKDAGISFSENDAISEWHKKKKTDLLVFDSHKTTTNDLDQKIIDYYKNIFSDIDKIESMLGDSLNVNLDGKFSYSEISEKLSKKILDGYTQITKDIGDSLSGMDFGSLGNIMTDGLSVVPKVDIDAIYNAWKSYASDIGVSTEQAILAGIAEIETEIKTMEKFNWSYFDEMPSSLTLMGEAAKKAQDDFSGLSAELNTSVNLRDFADKFRDSLKGIEFKPENIDDWKKLGESLRNAATETKGFISALEGMIAKYDTAIADFDKIIADFRGITLEAPVVEKDTMTIDAINKLADAVMGEQNQDKQLEAANAFADGIQKLNTDMDATLQSFLDGNATDTEALTAEISSTLDIGLAKVAEDISANNQAITDATSAGNTEMVAKLEEQNALLQNEQATLQSLSDSLASGGLSTEIVAGVQQANDLVFAQLSEDIKTALETEQTGMEAILAEQNAILANIEGSLIEANAQAQVQTDALVNGYNLDALAALFDSTLIPTFQEGTEATKMTRDALVAFPETISASMQPMADSVALLPEAFNSSIMIGMEPVNNTMISMSEAVGMLPESFNASMMPISESMRSMTMEMTTIAPEMKLGVIEAMAPVSTAMDTNTTAIISLQAMESKTAAAAEATTSAVNAAANQIASAVSGALNGAINSMNAQVSAAVSAAEKAASAATSQGAEIAAMNTKIGTIETNTRVTAVQTAVTATNTGG